MHHGAAPPTFYGTSDPRLVFARLHDRIVHMPDGEAEAFRRFKGELFCVVPGCPHPELTVVNRGESRRHGFRHLTAVEHSGMGVHHLQAQLLIAAWLRAKYPRSDVKLEATTEDGRRRADVMITAATGQKVAFEIQYSPMTFEAWLERHESYRAHGIVDVWLWGHVKPHLDGTGYLSRFLSQVAEHTGEPLLWVNPEQGLLATMSGVETVARDEFATPLRTGRGVLEVIRLDQLWLDLTGLRAKRLDELIAGDAARDAAERLMWLQMLLRLTKARHEYQQHQETTPAPTVHRPTAPQERRTSLLPSLANAPCRVCGKPLSGLNVSAHHSLCVELLGRELG